MLLRHSSECMNKVDKKVFTKEVEDAIVNHKYIADFQVTMPDERLGS